MGRVAAIACWVGLLAGAAEAQVSVHVTPWVRAGVTTVPGATGFQADADLIAHNAGVTTERVAFTLSAVDGPFIQAPSVIEFVLEPGELVHARAGVFSGAPLGASETVQHIVLVQPTVESVGALPGIGYRARPSSRFSVEPIEPVIDARGLPAQSVTVDLRVTNLSDAANTMRTLTFAAGGPIAAPAPIPVTLGVGESTVVAVPVTPTAGAGELGVEFADLIVLYTDDPALPAGAVQHASATLILGPVEPGFTPCPTDLNGDGITNGADITQILNAFGQICP